MATAARYRRAALEYRNAQWIAGKRTESFAGSPVCAMHGTHAVTSSPPESPQQERHVELEDELAVAVAKLESHLQRFFQHLSNP
jgi:hypothetical protein